MDDWKSPDVWKRSDLLVNKGGDRFKMWHHQHDNEDGRITCYHIERHYNYKLLLGLLEETF